MANEKGTNSTAMVVVSLGWKGDSLRAVSGSDGEAVTLGEDATSSLTVPAKEL